MAVYTHVAEAEAQTFLAAYDIGGLKTLTPIAEGVENTNYRLDTDEGRYILTLFEKRTDPKDLPFFMAAMSHFAARGVNAPAPIAMREGGVIGKVAGRSAVIITFLPGKARMAPANNDCAAVGATLAAMHKAAGGFPLRRANGLSLDGWRRLASACWRDADRCAPGLSEIIADEIAHQERMLNPGLPRGLVHADLFPDNVFFDARGAVSGVIDFYFACTDAFVYDLAITMNAWASDHGRFDEARAAALLRAYSASRALSAAERGAFNDLARGAALRFLLTRLYDFLHQVEGAVVKVKDPLEYRDLLVAHRSGAAARLIGEA
jgi:homoserine kinase type II